MNRSQRIIAAIVLVTAGGGWFIYQLLGPNPQLVIAEDTTWLTEPLADDGLPDYAKWLLDKQREGVTPENNAAIPFLQAMWPAEIDEEHQKLVCDEIGMKVPVQSGMTAPGDDANLVRELQLFVLARHNIFPPMPIRTQGEFDKWRAEYEATIAEPTDPDLGFVEVPTWQQEPFMRAEIDAAQLLDDCQKHPWQRNDVPPLSDWIDRHEREFALLHDAAQRREYYCPSATLLDDPSAPWVDVLLPDLPAMRNASGCLCIRFMMQIQNGDLSNAWQSCRDIYGLADHVMADTLVAQIFLIVIANQANMATQSLLDDERLSIGLAREISDYLSARNPRHEMAKSLDESERITCLTTVLTLFGVRKRAELHELWGDDPDQMDKIFSSRLDWNVALRIINQRYDMLAETARLSDRTEREEHLVEVESMFDDAAADPGLFFKVTLSTEGRSQVVADIISALFLPSLSAALVAQDRHNDDIQLMQIAAALAIHRIENGRYPDSLAALPSDLLAELPTDQYTGAKLVYQRTTDGYLLYNCGPNGEDDGGSGRIAEVFQGYQVDEVDDAFARKKLGLSPRGEDKGYLVDQIPEEADDRAIRMPPLRADKSVGEP